MLFLGTRLWVMNRKWSRVPELKSLIVCFRIILSNRRHPSYVSNNCDSAFSEESWNHHRFLLCGISVNHQFWHYQDKFFFFDRRHGIDESVKASQVSATEEKCKKWQRRELRTNVLRARPDLNAKIRAAPQSTPQSENILLVVGVYHNRLGLSSWRRWCRVRWASSWHHMPFPDPRTRRRRPRATNLHLWKHFASKEATMKSFTTRRQFLGTWKHLLSSIRPSESPSGPPRPDQRLKYQKRRPKTCARTAGKDRVHRHFHKTPGSVHIPRTKPAASDATPAENTRDTGERVLNI